METIRSVTVRDANGNERDKLNELEYVDGYIYANVWYSDFILRINPSTGLIEKQWDISSLD